MSGEQLRYDAQYGNHKRLRDVLKDRANTANADEYGLTPLMFAVWNGHVECVKYLICNDVGIDSRGVKVSALHMRSCKGYTALHLAALDSPKWCAKDLTRLLLIAGLDRTARCNEGYTPEDLAMKNSEPGSLEAFREFDMAESDPTLQAEYAAIKKTLLEKYTFIHNPTMNVEVWKAKFPVPNFIFDKQHVGALPDGMRIHEHMISPLREIGYTGVKDTIDALNMLDFSVEQADINIVRRAKLLSAGDVDGTWEPADLSQIRADKARAVIRAHSPYERKRAREHRQQEMEHLKFMEEQEALENEIAALKVLAAQEAEEQRLKEEEAIRGKEVAEAEGRKKDLPFW